MTRIVFEGNVGSREKWIEGFEEAGYLPHRGRVAPREVRMDHPEGSCVRMFECADDLDRGYIYPPGGTDRPTGAIVAPLFLGLKKKKEK